LHGLVRHDADRATAERSVTRHQIGRVPRSELQERVGVENVLDDHAHVVRRGRALRDDRGGEVARAVVRVVGLEQRRIGEVVVGQVPEQRRKRVAGCELVGHHE
jgi:hypothetical protein